MTTQYDSGRETVDLLEQILDRVESIDKNVEDLLDRIGGSYSEFLDRDAYDEKDHDEAYRW